MTTLNLGQLTFTLHVTDVKHLAALHRFAAEYYEDPKLALGKLKEPYVRTTIEKPSQTFYGYVTTNCSCGGCYSRFARSDRVPWTGNGAGRFISAKHGVVDITAIECPVKFYAGSGYIRDKSLEAGSPDLQKAAKIKKLNADAEVAHINAEAAKRKQAAACETAPRIDPPQTNVVDEERKKRMKAQATELNAYLTTNMTRRARQIADREIHRKHIQACKQDYHTATVKLAAFERQFTRTGRLVLTNPGDRDKLNVLKAQTERAEKKLESAMVNQMNDEDWLADYGRKMDELAVLECDLREI